MPLREHRVILGRAIRRFRDERGITQEKLAEKAELTAKYLGEVERGVVNISVDSLARIAAALRMRISDLTRDI